MLNNEVKPCCPTVWTRQRRLRWLSLSKPACRSPRPLYFYLLCLFKTSLCLQAHDTGRKMSASQSRPVRDEIIYYNVLSTHIASLRDGSSLFLNAVPVQSKFEKSRLRLQKLMQLRLVSTWFGYAHQPALNHRHSLS